DNPRNRPTIEEVYSCFEEYYMFHKFISEKEIKVTRSREAKHLEIIKLGWEYLLDKHHPESFFTSQPLIKLIEKANSPLNKLIIKSSNKLNKRGDDKSIGVINLSNELLKTLRVINFCIDCEKKF